MTELPFVSVVIPAYNRAHCVEAAIQTALDQEGVRVEVLVVDDGSKDDTRARILKTYGSEARVRYFYQENAGVSVARNKGIKEASAEFIALLDSDDLWTKNKLALQVHAMKKNPRVGLSYTDMDAVRPDGSLLSERYLKKVYKTYDYFPKNEDLFSNSFNVEGYSYYCGDIYSAMVLGSLVHTSTVMVTRDALNRVGDFDVTLKNAGEDYDFFLRMSRETELGYLDAVTLLYLVGAEDALTNPKNDLKFATHFANSLKSSLFRDFSRIKIPYPLLYSKVSDTLRWVGAANSQAGYRLKGFLYLSLALFIRPWDMLAFKFWVRSLIPGLKTTSK